MNNLDYLMEPSSLSDTQDYFKHVLEKNETATDNALIEIRK